MGANESGLLSCPGPGARRSSVALSTFPSPGWSPTVSSKTRKMALWVSSGLFSHPTNTWQALRLKVHCFTGWGVVRPITHRGNNAFGGGVRVGTQSSSQHSSVEHRNLLAQIPMKQLTSMFPKGFIGTHGSNLNLRSELQTIFL